MANYVFNLDEKADSSDENTVPLMHERGLVTAGLDGVPFFFFLTASH